MSEQLTSSERAAAIPDASAGLLLLLLPSFRHGQLLELLHVVLHLHFHEVEAGKRVLGGIVASD
jgi:hypothetical protein